MSMKPILFNTEMVRAIQDGRKTVTRRLVKPQPGFFYDVGGKIHDPDNPDHISFLAMMPDDHEEIFVPPYQPGDVLYVRETWRIQAAHRFEADARIEFRAGGPMTTLQFGGRCSDSHERTDYDSFINKWWSLNGKWHPSIFMPKEAARIFLWLKDVRVERLQDITADECAMEGIWPLYAGPVGGREEYYKEAFAKLWDSTIKPAYIPKYGWDANPWVWVSKFEKISKEEAMKC